MKPSTQICGYPASSLRLCVDGAASGCLRAWSPSVDRERTRWELSTEVDGGLVRRPRLRMMEEVSGRPCSTMATTRMPCGAVLSVPRG